MRQHTSLTQAEQAELLATLEKRFAAFPERHEGIAWNAVKERLIKQPQALCALQAMEDTGGQSDVIGVEPDTKAYWFVDCAPETPTDRRSLCYDQAALESRKTNKPAGSAEGLAQEMGIAVLTEAQYRALQALGVFDEKTSSWVQTPPEIRALGGALFCDRRYGRVFTYHNGAEAYYAARGFRGLVRV